LYSLWLSAYVGGSLGTLLPVLSIPSTDPAGILPLLSMDQALAAVVLSALSILLVIFTEDFDRSNRGWFVYSVVPALISSAIALVALPVYAYKTGDVAFFVFAVGFYVFEIAWLPITSLENIFLTPLVLFLAASSFTGAFVRGIFIYRGESELGWFVAVLALPLANLWINDLVVYTCYYVKSKTSTRYGQRARFSRLRY
jgi:hypothetical protein